MERLFLDIRSRIGTCWLIDFRQFSELADALAIGFMIHPCEMLRCRASLLPALILPRYKVALPLSRVVGMRLEEEWAVWLPGLCPHQCKTRFCVARDLSSSPRPIGALS